MALTIINQESKDKVVHGKPVKITYLYHSKKIDGLRTVRTEYAENMPLAAGGWLANTVTETVINGTGSSTKTVIPEHRVK